MTTVGIIDSIVPSVLRVQSFGDPSSGSMVTELPTSRMDDDDDVEEEAHNDGMVVVSWELARMAVVAVFSFGAATLRLISDSFKY